jgi:hypothetical protein
MLLMKHTRFIRRKIMSRMQRQWTIHRQVIPAREGRRRWDQAYQLLLQWTQPSQEESSSSGLLTQEDNDESRLVRARLHPAAGTNAND